ncbi:hypothetical protein C900_05528 [Fulvivirga imtechensis AK7]|uniref:Membrane dipeptidase n=1 Tax=Fulvivirga imtechensis AK7 TaxID=1237149 RepID=L8JLB9_9BACT|nr:membrane dipeptidase [Fulvivirga imtechensis]ELR69043.1 hypothetical protein C900_05528 [Fulvivirga imtechensis AK7]
MYFDLHCHPSFKTFLSNRKEHKRTSCWETLNFDIDANILDSQASFKQLTKGKVKLAVVPLHSLEWGFARSGLIKLAAGLSVHIEKRFIQAIEKKEYGYNELMHAEHRHLVKFTNVPAMNTVKLVNSMTTDFDENDGKLHLILAAEGGHNFYDDGQLVIDTQEVLNNLRYFKDPANPRLLYVTLTHLTHSEYCTHAYGMKLINHNVFSPNKKGITELGEKFIQEALDNTNGRRILIDIKHMSCVARMQYYKIRQQKFPDAPIMATHMGVAGVSYKNKPIRKIKEKPAKNCVEVFYYRNPGSVDTYFNPWSINLYDEDIREIVKSGGLIGLSLDQRILGVGNVSSEVFCPDEYTVADFKPVKKPKYHVLDHQKYQDPEECKKWHLRHLCNNLLHIIKVGSQEVGDKVWDHVCLGSDFDGLIDPINSCRNATEYPSLFGDMVQQLPVVAQAMGVPLPPAQVQPRLRQFVYENAVKFLKKHFS